MLQKLALINAAQNYFRTDLLCTVTEQ